MATGISVARRNIVSLLAEYLVCIVNSCDILLRLDDGIKMRAQWQALARHRKKCTDVLDGGPLSCTSGPEKVSVPLEGRSKEEASTFVTVPYSVGPASSIDESTGLSIARLDQDCFAYLAEGPEGLVNSCDILLKLDDGTRLPAHSPVLARFSPVFAGMLDEGPLSGASGKSRVDVPLSGCSLDESVKFLSMLYSATPNKHLMASPFAIVKGVMDLCDDLLSGLAGIKSGGEAYLLNKSKEAFLEMLDAAIMYDMPKLLACCEHHITANILEEDEMCLPSEYKLEEHVPIMSALRIAKAHRMALSKSFAWTPSEYGSKSGRIHLQEAAEFLQMAQSKT